MSICDLSPHLGHKLAASIFSGYIYERYIVDAQNSLDGIEEVLLYHFSEEKMKSFLKLYETEEEVQSHQNHMKTQRHLLDPKRVYVCRQSQMKMTKMGKWRGSLQSSIKNIFCYVKKSFKYFLFILLQI